MARKKFRADQFLWFRVAENTISEFAGGCFSHDGRFMFVNIQSPGFTLVIEDPSRFVKRPSAGAYLGLVPARDQSGNRDPQKHISKEGDEMLRRLLVGSAHYLLGPFGSDSDLRRHGEKIASRGGKNANKRAVVAVAGCAPDDGARTTLHSPDRCGVTGVTRRAWSSPVRSQPR